MPITATGAAYPVTINGTGYHLYRRPGKSAVVTGKGAPGDISQQQVSQDVPRLWDDWSGGSGYSRRDARIPNGYAYCIGDARYPRVFAPAGETRRVALPTSLGLPAATYDSFELPGIIGFCMGSQIVQVSMTSGEYLGVMRSFTPPCETTGAEIFDGGLIVGMTGQNLHRYDIATGVWAASVDVKRDWLATVYWVVAGVGAYRLVGAVQGTHEIKIFPANPTAPGNIMVDADWSAPYPIGGPDRVIRNLAASADHVYVVKTDGIYDIDGRGYAPNLTPYWRDQFNASSGLTSAVIGDYVYAAHVMGLDRVKIGAGPNRDRPEWCHPGVGQSAEGPAFGTVRAVGSDGPWIVGAQFNGTDSWICYGQSRDQPGVPAGPGPVLWHQALTTIPAAIVTHVRVHEVAGSPWLFIAGVDSQTGRVPVLYRMALARAASPLQALAWPQQYGSSFPFSTTATLVLPADDWGDATAVKTLRRYDIQADDLGEQVTTILLSANAEGGPYVAQERVTASPRETLAPVEPLTTGYQIGLKLDLEGTAAAPALLRALKARAAVSVDATEQRVYRLRLGQATEGYGRARDRRDPEVLFALLSALQAVGPVPMRDHRGRDLSVKVENVAQEEHEVPGSDGRRWEIVAVVSLSVLSRPGFWDVSIWGTDAQWSA